jgi:hypothetical protein
MPLHHACNGARFYRQACTRPCLSCMRHANEQRGLLYSHRRARKGCAQRCWLGLLNVFRTRVVSRVYCSHGDVALDWFIVTDLQAPWTVPCLHDYMSCCSHLTSHTVHPASGTNIDNLYESKSHVETLFPITQVCNTS